VVIGDNEQGIKTVAGNLGAIGYVSVGAAEYAATHDVAIRLLPLDGIPASIETVKDGSFPLSRPLNLVTRGQAQGLAGTSSPTPARPPSMTWYGACTLFRWTET
jgi:phosphate transport system substrate-binding protein